MSETTPIIVKKKKIQAAAHHGGSWKVAYADFVTAMMAFFMVMWIMGMSAETRSMVAGYFNDPLGFMKNPPKSKSPFSIAGSPATKPGIDGGPEDKKSMQEQLKLKEVSEQFKEAMKEDVDLKALAKHVEITLEDEGLRIELVESAGAVFFETGRDVIRPVALKLVSKIGPILARSTRPIIVEGHTDAAPYSGLGYTNMDLSADRALALRRALSQFGVPLEQFEEVRGFGSKQLKNRADPLHFSNRRVTLMLPFSKTLKPIDNLPKDALKSEVQGVFKKELGLLPDPKRVDPSKLNIFGEPISKDR